ncbi:MAG: preprotein translocase subunit YajC [Oscillospiraceae bacterium]|nr:preprotein translocase subunit YajC [Oscillospiraceae bacterium]
MNMFLGIPVFLEGAPADAPADAPNSMIITIGYIVFFGAIMYFLLYRPQKKREAKARELIASLQVGMKVTTTGGIVGKIINIKDDIITIETSIERTQIEVQKWAIKDVEKPLEA